MDIGVISVRYARALIKAATGMKLEDQVYQEMQTLYKSYIDVPELRFTIDNPMLSKDKKQALLTTALGEKPSDLSKKFVALVLIDGASILLSLIEEVELYYRCAGCIGLATNKPVVGALCLACVISPFLLHRV